LERQSANDPGTEERVLHLAFDHTPDPGQRVGVRPGGRWDYRLHERRTLGREVVEESLVAHRDLDLRESVTED
jgi:hypothetical protein